MTNLLEHIDYEITKACNLSCVHCSAEAGNGDHPNLEQIKNVLTEAKKLGLKRVGITGGEPFLFPNELADLIDFSYDFLGCPVHIHSNGQLVKDNLGLILDKFKKIENLTLTLMGCEQTHDKNTGKTNSYEALRSSAQALTDIKIPSTIFLIPMSNNYQDLPKAITDFYKIGMKHFRVMRLSPGGRARQNYESLKLDNNQSATIIRELKSLEDKLGLEFEAGFCTRILYPDLKPLKYHPYCLSGINRLHINAEGYVFPCTASSGFIELSVGNINEQLLENIWNNSDALIRLREKFPATDCNVQNFYNEVPKK